MTSAVAALILDRVRALPALPSAVVDVMRAVDDPNADFETLVRQIGRDPPLAARALRVANSPFYGLARKIGTLREAITVVGLHGMATMVTAAAVVGGFRLSDGHWFDARAFWRHAFAVAACARSIAEAKRINPEQAATAGLIHDIGTIALVVCAPELYRGALELAAERGWRAERDAIGTDHVEALAALVERWNLPDALRQAVIFHHEPDGTGSRVADIVHVADVVCHALDFGRTPGAAVPRLSHGAWERLDLGWPELRKCMASTERRLDGFESAIRS